MAQIIIPSDQKIDNTENLNPLQQQTDLDGDAPIVKRQLSNGMTLLVREMHNIPRVSVNIWYNVGSKDEKIGEKGVAHFIEHMIFKGTSGKGSLNLSECDINVIMNKLSGKCNAFTSFDYTGYWFNLPTQNWQQLLPIMADCMLNAAFKDDHINSEMKAVIQELKMRKDNYQLSLIEELMTTIFADHPYHYPIIGYKQDLWNIHSKDLAAFYKKHYGPQNATLLIVGDVDADEVFDLAEQYFGKIPANKEYKKEEYYFNKDIISKSVTLYRDIKQPVATLAFVIPGMSAYYDPALDLLSWILGNGKGSRLYKRLVDELKLVTSIDTDGWHLFDHSVFFVMYEPKNIDDMQAIEAVIMEELDSINTKGLQKGELSRAIKKAKSKQYSLLENMQDQAYAIGKYYLATGDENYLFNYLKEPEEALEQEILTLVKDYMRPSVTHRGALLPLPEEEKAVWLGMQQASDEDDTKFLGARKRTSPLEPPLYAKKVEAKDAGIFDFPKAESFDLANGATVLYHHNANVPKIYVSVSFKAEDHYDPQDKPGLYRFMSAMISEGTEKYPNSAALANAIESRGMSFAAFPGGVAMSMLADDFEDGLAILQELLTKATFPQEALEKIRSHMLSDVKQFWDDPSSISDLKLREVLYKDHPYSKNGVGTPESINGMTRADLVDLYKKFVTPAQATIAIVGDLEKYDIAASLAKTIGAWSGPIVEDLACPPLTPASPTQINFPLNRDQVILCFANLSVERTHPDYDKLYLFNQIFGGGVIGSMNSRLFKLREQSGLFYHIGGTLTSGSDKQPGKVLVRTQVSLDRLAEAEKAIKHTIDTCANTIEQHELVTARNAIVNSLTSGFETNANIAASFLLLDKYGFPANYFDTWGSVLAGISKEDIQAAVKKFLRADQMVTVRVGRVEAPKEKAKK